MKVTMVSEKTGEKVIVMLPYINSLTYRVAKAVVVLNKVSVPALVAGNGEYTRIVEV